MLEYNKIPENMPTLDEIWRKLSGGKPLSDYPIYEPTTVYECDTVYSDIPTLADFQKAMDRVMQERGKK